jgi:hypothetical protein
VGITLPSSKRRKGKATSRASPPLDLENLDQLIRDGISQPNPHVPSSPSPFQAHPTVLPFNPLTARSPPHHRSPSPDFNPFSSPSPAPSSEKPHNNSDQFIMTRAQLNDLLNDHAEHLIQDHNDPFAKSLPISSRGKSNSSFSHTHPFAYASICIHI